MTCYKDDYKEQLAQYQIQNEINISLIDACRTNNLEAARTCICLGASLCKFRARSSEELWTPSPMSTAISKKYLEMMRLLLEYGADPNEVTGWGNTLLHDATRDRLIDGVRLLIEFGANVNYRNSKGENVAHVAAQNEDQEILKIVRPNIVESDVLIDALRYGTASQIRFLLENRADFRSLNGLGVSVLDKACRLKNYEGVKLLLEAGADPNLRQDRYCMTPLHSACCYTDSIETRVKIAAELIRYGADISSLWIARPEAGGMEYNAPLHVAARAEFYKMVKLLVISGATVADNLRIDSQGKQIITKVVELNEWDKKKTVLALQPFWTPATWYLFPSEINKNIMYLYLLHRAQNWPFDKSIMQRISSFIVAGFYQPKKELAHKKRKMM